MRYSLSTVGKTVATLREASPSLAVPPCLPHAVRSVSAFFRFLLSNAEEKLRAQPLFWCVSL